MKIPRVRLVNFRKHFRCADTSFGDWFTVRKFFGGRLIVVSVKSYSVSFDFR